ncbi:SDR family oxidoreductase [Spirosoma montaniterrae]|uniref:Short-chain dehydrogenase n=1 Tax=Spirosoma montaniterrae TaxID=1178516 RepID=A0A1P9WT11_9BACT|nr:SDR family oxidoreductase [Spirosoma montaniterrae]AQG78525.1 short-chain dehydrogenase [Spirosoma montaniterrae]
MSIILITGCSTGLGYATAEHLARAGHTVYATMRNPQRAPELSQLAQRDGLPITVLPMDVDSDDSVRQTVADVVAQAGQIDVLVNNAGIGPVGPVEERPLSEFAAIMQTNYFGTLRCIQAVLPGMRERRSGCIVNVSSVAGKVFSAYHSAYCASKAAVEALSECLAGEVAPFGIRVALVQPGVIDTPIIDKMGDALAHTNYPNQIRLVAYLRASRDNHAPALLVAEVIEAIITGKHTELRAPVGPDAAPLLGWRASLPDEHWIGVSFLDEDAWVAGMAEFGVNVRPYLNAVA